MKHLFIGAVTPAILLLAACRTDGDAALGGLSRFKTEVASTTVGGVSLTSSSGSSSSGGPVRILPTIETRFTSFEGIPIGVIGPDDPVSAAGNRISNGINYRTTYGENDPRPLMTGVVTMTGTYRIGNPFPANRTTNLEARAGLSTLNFDFTNNTATGTATNFGVYSLSDARAQDNIPCTVSTCAYTRERDAEGTIELRGTIDGTTNPNILPVLRVVANGTLTDTAADGTVTRQTLTNVGTEGRFHRNADSTRFYSYALNPSGTVSTQIGDAPATTSQTLLYGEWLQERPAVPPPVTVSPAALTPASN